MDEFGLRLITAGEFILGATGDAVRREAARSSATADASDGRDHRTSFVAPTGLGAALTDWDGAPSP